MTWLIVLVITTLIIVVVLIGMYNKLTELKQKTDNAFESVDKTLTKKFELVPDLLDTIKDTIKYEDKIISEISTAKTDYLAATCVADKSKASEILFDNLNSLFTISEAYPELSSNAEFLNIQEKLTSNETDFEYSIKLYNDAAQAYNTAILSFPQTAVAHLFNFEKASFFEK